MTDAPSTGVALPTKLNIVTMSDKRVLFISQEIAPYLTGNPLADFGKQLAQNVHSHKFEVRTFMPKYGSVNERRNQLHEVIRLSGLNISIDDNDHPLIIKVASLQPSRIQVYFIDNDDYFQKADSDADAIGSNRTDNDERAIFFARGTVETVKKLKWEPSVILVNGWMAALTPIYLRQQGTEDPSLKNAKIVYVITEGEAAGGIDSRMVEKMAQEKVAARALKEFKTMPANTDLLHKMALRNSNAVVVATEISDDLRAYIEELKLPVLEYKIGEDDIDKIYDFYQQLI